MDKRKITYTRYLTETTTIIADPGALLVTQGNKANPNVMAIGWGTIGVVWSIPIFCVLIRHSRLSYQYINETGEFTVNIPYPSMGNIVEYCGTYSGREHDKFCEQSLTAIPSNTIIPPLIKECAIHYECRVIHKHDIAPSTIPEDIIEEYYPEDDFHRVFYGKILQVSADESFRESLIQ